MTVYMTQTEYAGHRGISQPRVSRMIKNGKLQGCIKRISGRKLIDRDLADAALEVKPDRVYLTQRDYAKHRGVSQPRISRLVKEGKLAGCIETIDGKNLIDRDLADTALEENLDRIHNRPKSISTCDQTSVIKSAGMEMLTLADAQQLRENYTAALKKLEYETKKRELIPAGEAKLAFADTILTARTKILAIKGKLAPLIKEFVEDQGNFSVIMTSVEDALRDVLTEMADAETNFS